MNPSEQIEDTLTAFATARFDNSYARLAERFYGRVNPVAVKKAEFLMVNDSLARELGLDMGQLETDASLAVFAGNHVLKETSPIAMAYAGHQFGHFSPQLGDGRAVILGEMMDREGHRRDLQLKGSGRTPFSRGGDGRSPLGPVIREYIVSEAMHALGVPSTRSLAAVATGETVYRENPLPGGVLTRVASSHIRVGTFEYFAARGDEEAVKLLADYVIERHYPQLREAGNPYLALLEAIVKKQSYLVARWMELGFIHGVMNTDNMTISGETIDYGPCAFMDNYEPSTVFSAIDRQGRYAYQNQSLIAQWNLARLAECLLPLIHSNKDQGIELVSGVIHDFSALFEKDWLRGMCKKIGLNQVLEGDKKLLESLLSLMQANQADYTLTFRELSSLPEKVGKTDPLYNLLGDSRAVQDWLANWQLRLKKENQSSAEQALAMKRVNPMYIPRNHRVEAVIVAAVQNGDYNPMRELNQVLQTPYAEQEEFSHYSLAPKPEEQVKQTFCGT